MLNLLLSSLFIFNLVASIGVVKMVGGHMEYMIRSGKLPRWIKTWAMLAIGVEGVVSLLSFLALREDGIVIYGMDYHMILLAVYAGALANIYLWVFVFHQKKWYGGSGDGRGKDSRGESGEEGSMGETVGGN